MVFNLFISGVQKTQAPQISFFSREFVWRIIEITPPNPQPTHKARCWRHYSTRVVTDCLQHQVSYIRHEWLVGWRGIQEIRLHFNNFLLVTCRLSRRRPEETDRLGLNNNASPAERMPAVDRSTCRLWGMGSSPAQPANNRQLELMCRIKCLQSATTTTQAAEVEHNYYCHLFCGECRQ